MAPTSGKRVSLSIDTKMKILADVDKNLKSKTEIAKDYKLSSSSLSTILKNRATIMKTDKHGCSSNRMRCRDAKWPALEKALVDWLKNIRCKNVPVDGKLLKAKTETFALQMGIENIRISDGWLQRFRKRHGIAFRKLCGKSAQEPTEIETDCINVPSVGISNCTGGIPFTNIKTPTPASLSKQATASPIKKTPQTTTSPTKKTQGMDKPSTSAQDYVSLSEAQEPNEPSLAAPSCSTITTSVSTASVQSDNSVVSSNIKLKQNVAPGLEEFTTVKPRLTNRIFMTFLATNPKELRKLFVTLKENSIVEALMVTRMRTAFTDLSRYIHIYLVINKKMKHTEIQSYVEGVTGLCCVAANKVVKTKTLVSFMHRSGCLKFNIKIPCILNDQKTKRKKVVFKISGSKPVSNGLSLNPTNPNPDEIAPLPTCEINSPPVSHDENTMEISDLDIDSKVKEMFAKREAEQNLVMSLKREVDLKSQELATKKRCLESATKDLEQTEKDCSAAVDLQQELHKQQQHIDQQKRIKGEMKKKLVQTIESALSTQNSKK